LGDFFVTRPIRFYPHTASSVFRAHYDYLGSRPFDVLPTLCFLFQAGKIKILTMTGKVFYRGTADVALVHFEKDYIPEDWM